MIGGKYESCVKDIRIEGDAVHATIEMSWEQFGRYLLWKQIEDGMSFEDCEAWIDRDYASVKPHLSVCTVTEGDPELMGRKLWVAMPPQITFTCTFEEAKDGQR